MLNLGKWKFDFTLIENGVLISQILEAKWKVREVKIRSSLGDAIKCSVDKCLAITVVNDKEFSWWRASLARVISDLKMFYNFVFFLFG